MLCSIFHVHVFLSVEFNVAKIKSLPCPVNQKMHLLYLCQFHVFWVIEVRDHQKMSVTRGRTAQHYNEQYGNRLPTVY